MKFRVTPSGVIGGVKLTPEGVTLNFQAILRKS